MDRQKLLAAINDEITQLQTAAALLSGTQDRTVIKSKGRRKGFVISAAARKRISDAQKARWAKQRAQHAAAVKSGKASDGFRSKKKATKKTPTTSR